MTRPPYDVGYGKPPVHTRFRKGQPGSPKGRGNGTIVQSWDTANKPSELADYSVCTTWGVKNQHFFLLHVLRKKLGYPDLSAPSSSNPGSSLQA